MSRQIKEKMEKLDTLSGGIVFGKDEAWERLHARMDKKPAKKIAVRFWLAAAAILLLFVCITAIYNTPEKEIAVVPITIETKQPISIVVSSQTQAPVKSNQKAIKIATVKKSPEDNVRSNEKESEYDAIKEISPTVVEEEVAVTNPVVPIPVKKQMRVVHINDLENKEVEDVPILANNLHPVVNMNRMKVVSVNEVIKDAPGIITHNFDRPYHSNISFFSKPVDNNNDTNPNDMRIAQNPLKIKFNIQN